MITTVISMPELNGIELVKRLRTQPEFDHVPILVLTAFDNEKMDKAIRAGAHRAINKPAILDSLMDEVRDLFSRVGARIRSPQALGDSHQYRVFGAGFINQPVNRWLQMVEVRLDQVRLRAGIQPLRNISLIARA